jgi:hypothetical protein
MQPTETSHLKNYQAVKELFSQFKLDVIIDKLLAGQENISRIYPLRGFQRALLRVANSKRITYCIAPSQSGKTSAAAAFMLPLLFQDDSLGAWYSNNEDNAQKLQDIFVRYILGNDKIAKALYKADPTYTKKAGIGMPTITQVGRRRDGVIRIENTGATFIAKAATVGSLSGKSPDRLHLDEMAIWSSDKQGIYNEALARMGDTRGKILVTSTVDAPGRYEYAGDRRVLKGNLFYAEFQRLWEQQQINPNCDTAALNFTYHVSENLLLSYHEIATAMPDNYLLKHYWGYPLKTEEGALFSEHFDPEKHVKTRQELLNMTTSNEVLVLSLDPGNDKAITVLSYDRDKGRIIIWETHTANKSKGEPEFIQEVWANARRNFHFATRWAVTGDIAMNHSHSNSQFTSEGLLREITRCNPILKRQTVHEGVELMKRYFTTPDSIFLCKEDTVMLQHCLSTAIVYGKDRDTGALVNNYPKDGVHDHTMDSCRYGCYNITSCPPGGSHLPSLHLPSTIRFA